MNSTVQDYIERERDAAIRSRNEWRVYFCLMLAVCLSLLWLNRAMADSYVDALGRISEDVATDKARIRMLMNSIDELCAPRKKQQPKAAPINLI